MSDQLWTSPLTGYRRRGTRIADMRSTVGGSITARAILQRLQSCGADKPATEMAQLLKEHNFDIAGVRESEVGDVIGFVSRTDLVSGQVKDHLRAIKPKMLVSDSTALGDLMTVLESAEHLLVLVGSHVEGIVTRADLNKPPVRVYLFGLISLLELHLNFWISTAYEGDSWKARLKTARIEAAEKLLTDRRRHNDASTLLGSLQFCDKRDIVLAKDDLRTHLGLGSKTEADRLLKKAEVLRNDLAHSQSSIAAGSSWPEVLRLAKEVDALLHRSDQLVEERAREGKFIDPPFW